MNSNEYQFHSKRTKFGRKKSLRNSIKSLIDSGKSNLQKDLQKNFFFKKSKYQKGKENDINEANKLQKLNKRSSSRFKVRRHSTYKPEKKSKKISPSNLFGKKLSADLRNIQIAKKRFSSSTLLKNYRKIKSKRLSLKEFVNVYAANTHNGRCRNYNEDRVSIILNIVSKSEHWYKDTKIRLENDFNPTRRVSFFGLYDGHAGSSCADFLKDNLHDFITSSTHFKKDKSKALFEGIIQAENEFKKKSVRFEKEKKNLNLNLAAKKNSPSSKKKNPKILDHSGSCATICLFESSKGYIANVGDSRIILSSKKGREIKQLTNDHKPESEDEKERILKYGGAITKKQSLMRVKQIDEDGKMFEVDKMVEGPCRVNPGGLSVSRTIGDFQSKLTEFGGNPMCVIPIPELGKFSIEDDTDFLVMACDGVFDVLSNEEVVRKIWEVLRRGGESLENLAEDATEEVINLAIEKESSDNLTVVVVLFKGKGYYRNKCVRFHSSTLI